MEKEERSGRLNGGNVAILRFISGGRDYRKRFVDSVQRAFGGIQDNEDPGLGGGGSPPYIEALEQLDEDMPQYIKDNTDDEISHAAFQCISGIAGFPTQLTSMRFGRCRAVGFRSTADGRLTIW